MNNNETESCFLFNPRYAYTVNHHVLVCQVIYEPILFSVYRNSFRQTLAEMEAPTGDWKRHTSFTMYLFGLALLYQIYMAKVCKYQYLFGLYMYIHVLRL